MKFTTKKENLFAAIKLIKKVVKTKCKNTPILENIVLEVKNESLQLRTFNLEIETIQIIDANDLGKGHEVVNFLALERILKSLPKNTEIKFEPDAAVGAKIIAKGVSLKLKTDIINDFPVQLTDKYECTASIPSGKLYTLLHKISYAMAKRDVRYYLNGVLMRFSKNGLKVVAADGHRMAFSSIAGIRLDALDGYTLPDNMEFIIERNTVELLIKMLNKKDLNITVSFGRGIAEFKYDGFTLTTKLIDAKYPDYQCVIPDYHTSNTVKINKDELLSVLTMAASASNEKFKGVKLSFDGDVLRVECNNDSQSGYDQSIECINNNYDTIIAGFDATYIIDALKKIVSDFVTIQIKDYSSSILINGSHLVMSARL